MLFYTVYDFTLELYGILLSLMLLFLFCAEDIEVYSTEVLELTLVLNILILNAESFYEPCLMLCIGLKIS